MPTWNHVIQRDERKALLCIVIPRYNIFFATYFACAASLLGLLSGCGDTGGTDNTAVIFQSAGAADNTAGNSGKPANIAGWPCFRGPEWSGRSHAEDLPLTWSRTENMAWTSPLPGPGASSPIVWGDRVYLTCYTGYALPDQPGGRLEDLRRHLLAIRLADGELLWERTIPARLPEEEHIRDHGYAANTPAADEAGVIVFLGKSGVLAFDHAGELRWQTDVGSNTSGWGTAASPVLWEDFVFINASVESESLVALDRQTGDLLWRARGITEAWNTPVVLTSGGREELVVASQGQIRAFNPRNGNELWTCRTDITWYMVPSPVVAQNVLYYQGGRSGVTALAVRAGGTGDVTSTHRLWTSHEGSNVSSPVYLDGYLYWMNDQRGVAYCARADTGEILYTQRLERAGQVYASALLAAGRVYYLTREGKTFILAATPEFEQLAVNDLNDGSLFNGSPAVVGRQLLIRSDKALYCIGTP